MEVKKKGLVEGGWVGGGGCVWRCLVVLTFGEGMTVALGLMA
jgi:hypothetical protein